MLKKEGGRFARGANGALGRGLRKDRRSTRGGEKERAAGAAEWRGGVGQGRARGETEEWDSLRA